MLESKPKVMELETETILTRKMKNKPTAKLTPLIEKMKLELSPIFEKKGNRNHHLENDAKYFPLESKD
jgi:hypothetical protein